MPAASARRARVERCRPRVANFDHLSRHKPLLFCAQPKLKFRTRINGDSTNLKSALARVERAASDWDTALYLKFEEERTQPARDLLARVPHERAPHRRSRLRPRHQHALLAARYPDAEIVGVDNSEQMLQPPRRARLPGFAFEKHDIGAWRPAVEPDLIFANAALQWLPNHHELIPRLMSFLADGGRLAIQMPDNRQEPSHALMRMVAADGPWADRLVPVAKTRGLIGIYSDYYAWLKPLSARGRHLADDLCASFAGRRRRRRLVSRQRPAPLPQSARRMRARTIHRALYGGPRRRLSVRAGRAPAVPLSPAVRHRRQASAQES